MILHLQMPYVDRTIHSGELLQWHASPGDFVNYGDQICTVRVSKLVRLRRNLMASRIARRRAEGQPEYYLKGSKGFRIYVRLTATDTGFLKSVHVGPGTTIETGTLLATFATEQGEAVDQSSPSSTFRVIGNVIEHSEVDPL